MRIHTSDTRPGSDIWLHAPVQSQVKCCSPGHYCFLHLELLPVLIDGDLQQMQTKQLKAGTGQVYQTSWKRAAIYDYSLMTSLLIAVKCQKQQNKTQRYWDLKGQE